MNRKIVANECRFSASLSGGAGGQSVNKVNTKVELRFDIAGSKALTEYEKQLIFRKLANRINGIGELVIVSQAARTQKLNKDAAIEKFFNLIENALKPVKKRKKTKPTKASKERRLKGKQIQAKKKINRRIVIE